MLPQCSRLRHKNNAIQMKENVSCSPYWRFHVMLAQNTEIVIGWIYINTLFMLTYSCSSFLIKNSRPNHLYLFGTHYLFDPNVLAFCYIPRRHDCEHGVSILFLTFLQLITCLNLGPVWFFFFNAFFNNVFLFSYIRTASH